MSSGSEGSQRKLSSEVWYHFTKEEGGKGKCAHCEAIITMSAGSISNLKRHLVTRHPHAYLGNSAESYITKVKNRKLVGNHWGHFERINSRQARCVHCDRIISLSNGSTGNLSRHLKLRHAIGKPTTGDDSYLEVEQDFPVEIGEEIEVEIDEEDSSLITTSPQTNDEQPFSEYCNAIILEDSLAPKLSPAQVITQPHLVQKKQQQSCLDVLNSSGMFRNEDEFFVFGYHLANKMRKLPSDQIPIVEKLLMEVLFEAQAGRINMTSKLSIETNNIKQQQIPTVKLLSNSSKSVSTNPNQVACGSRTQNVLLLLRKDGPTIKQNDHSPHKIEPLTPVSNGIHIETTKQESQTNDVLSDPLPINIKILPNSFKTESVKSVSIDHSYQCQENQRL